MTRASVVVHHLPPASVAGDLAVVIDVLRWSTTAVTALANGATAVEAFATVEEARARATAIGALAAGERGAHRIAGFDLGNSPLEMTPERVAGRVLCSTTTNGTRALLATAAAPHRFVAAFVNLSATAAAIRALDPRVVEIVCAGSEGEPSPEDSACAEALAALLQGNPVGQEAVAILKHAPHAARLRALGYAADVEFAGTLDSCPLVAVVREGRVVRAVGAG